MKPDMDYRQLDAQISNETTQKTDFKAYELTPRTEPFRPGPYTKPEGNIDSQTSYNQDFLYQYAEKTKPIRPSDSKQSLGKFEDDTTAKSDYKSWPLSRVDLIKPESSYDQPEGSFGGDSTYLYDYRQSNQPRVGLIKPENGPVRSNEPFVSRTSNKDHFIEHSLPPKFFKEKPAYKRVDIPVESMTTSHRDYGYKEAGQQLKSFKPDNTIKPPETAMVSDTTQKSDYKEWSLPPMFKRAGVEWHPPDNQMENITSYSTEFTHRSNERAQPFKPTPRERTKTKFESDTTYKNHYLNAPGEKRELLKAKGEYKLSTSVFEGSSTYKGHYTPQHLDKTAAFKPQNNFKPTESPFEGMSHYKADFGIVLK
jgi:hypothetical protein